MTEIVPRLSPSNGAVFHNSLLMPFVPVPGTTVLFCMWEVRVRDYAAFAGENPAVESAWQELTWLDYQQTPNDPVVNVSWWEAKAFCGWLSTRERVAYRLPTAEEWSLAVGMGNAHSGIEGGEVQTYPWGNQWPPPVRAGNYAGEEVRRFGFRNIDGYWDPHLFTAPVGSYRPNQYGIFDLGGNVWEWCDDSIAGFPGGRSLRGGSWFDSEPKDLRSGKCNWQAPDHRSDTVGFRIVVER